MSGALTEVGGVRTVQAMCILDLRAGIPSRRGDALSMEPTWALASQSVVVTTASATIVA
jgi:hypothetical protein